MFAARCEPFECVVELPDWRVYVAQLAFNVGRDLGDVMDVAVGGALDWLARRRPDGSSETAETLRLVRDGIAQTGVDLSGVRLFSEVLCDRLASGRETAQGCLAWQFLCVLVARSAAPWSVLDRKTMDPPLVFRMGHARDWLVHDGAPVRCDGLPVLADRTGVRASPWTHAPAAQLDACTDPLFVCYLPAVLMRRIDPKTHLGRLVWLTWAYKFAFARTFSHQGGGR